MTAISLNPLVSVVVPSYNGEKYLEEALLSIFGQTYRHYEVIVVDDGSATDAVRRICEKYKDKIRYIRHQYNKGLSTARNEGIMKSKGKYIAFLDDDDVWLQDKLEKQVAFYEKLESQENRIGLVYSGLCVIDESGKVLHKGLYSSAGNNYPKILFFDFVGTPSSVMTKRSVLNQVGFFDDEMRGREDYDMWIRIAKKYPVYSLNEFLTKYRVRRNTLSKNPDIMVSGLERIFRKVFAECSDMDLNKKKALELRVCREAALRFKNAAYNRLFIERNAKAFRQLVQRGLSYDRSLYGVKTFSYYFLSFFSVGLCRVFRRVKPSRLFYDVLVNVDHLDLESWPKMYMA